MRNLGVLTTAHLQDTVLAGMDVACVGLRPASDIVYLATCSPAPALVAVSLGLTSSSVLHWHSVSLAAHGFHDRSILRFPSA